jgi:hypothetical protein
VPHRVLTCDTLVDQEAKNTAQICSNSSWAGHSRGRRRASGQQRGLERAALSRQARKLRLEHIAELARGGQFGRATAAAASGLLLLLLQPAVLNVGQLFNIGSAPLFNSGQPAP